MERVPPIKSGAKEVICDQIWNPEDQEKLLKICMDSWIKKLVPKLVENVCLLMDQELSAIPCLSRADLKFALKRQAPRQTPREDFLFEHVLPILLPLKLEADLFGKAYKLLEKEYANLTNF